jgi:hypothetical protein
MVHSAVHGLRSCGERLRANGAARVRRSDRRGAARRCVRDIGDSVRVSLRLDTEARTVEVPDDLRAAFDAAGLGAAFDRLAFSHRREHVAWVTEARRPETRARRIAATVERLRA